MLSRICFIGILLVFFLYTGCDYSRQYAREDLYYDELGKMAVLPFNNHTATAQAGEILTRLFTTELLARKEFMIVPAYELKTKLGVNAPAEGEDIIMETSLDKISEKLGVNSVIIGTVTEYQYKKGVREKPVVGIDVKCYMADTSEVVWACSYTLEEIQFLFHKGSCAETAQKVCRHVVDNLEKNLSRKSE